MPIVAAEHFLRELISVTNEIKLLPTDNAIGDYFGYSVSIYGDTMVSGALRNDDPNDSGERLQ